MKVLKVLGYIIAGIILIVLLLGIIAPSDFKVERTVSIDAPPDFVWQHVNTLEKMNEWSPWAELDPDQKTEYMGESGTVGSKMTWDGDENVGKGSQEIVNVEEGQRVDTKLKFLEPLESESDAYITVNSADEGTEVAWGFTGSSPFPMNAMMLFMDMDAQVGKDFENGLNNLKEMVGKNLESANNSEYDIKMNDVGKMTYVLKKDTVKFAEMSKFYETHLGAIFGALQKDGAMDKVTGAASGIYFTWEPEKQRSYMAAAVPVADKSVTVQGYETMEVPAGRALQLDYYGSYEGSEEAHMAMDGYIKNMGLTYSGPVVEAYITDPEEEPDTSKWLTKITYYVEK